MGASLFMEQTSSHALVIYHRKHADPREFTITTAHAVAKIAIYHARLSEPIVFRNSYGLCHGSRVRFQPRNEEED